MSPQTACEKSRLCSPFTVAAAGAAVCLSGGNAVAVSGTIAASNAGDNVLNDGDNLNVFNSEAGLSMFGGPGTFYLASGGNLLEIARTVGGSAQHFAAGVNVDGALNFASTAYAVGNQSNNYLALTFQDGGARFGWIHVVSTDGLGSAYTLDTWSYNASGGSILTLDESITPKKLALSDGRVKLHWANANEDGVARYEVQAKSAGGEWSAMDADTPGAGSYASTLSGGQDYRLLVENSDGSTRTIAF